MIHKIERITSLGKFRNYQASGQVDFHRLTLIYGDNGGGKTTLASIMRSLTNNDPGIVKSRISTNQTAPQAVQIIQRNSNGDIHHTFNPRSGWTSSFPNIEIFDIHFVNENIYSGFEFNDEHKKQLHQFVIGAQGLAIQMQIEQNKTDKTASRQAQSNIENQLIQQVGNNLTPDLIASFLTIPIAQANNIDQFIADAERALVNATSNSVIQTLQPLSSLEQISSDVDFDALITDLQTTSQSIQDATLQSLFSSHCQDLTNGDIEGAEDWLGKGFNYVENKKANEEEGVSAVLSCPFCKSPIDDTSEIIRAYALQFNSDFNSLVQRIRNYLTTLQSFNLDAVIQAFNNIQQINSERIASWMPHLPSSVQPPVFNVISDEANLRKIFQAVISLVSQKIQNPSVPVTTTSATDFQSLLQIIESNINSYNQNILIYNTAITTFRNTIQTVANAQIEVARLKRIKNRFETGIASLCTQLIAEKQKLRTLGIAYPLLIQQQETAASAFFTSYKTQINYYLGTVFKTLFRIDDVVHVPPQGRGTQSKIGYKLTIDGQDISFSANQPFGAKECLSEGDKSTIALAFFLSKLDIDPVRQDKILVFDDPLSSLDTNRRTYTIGIIKELFCQMKQVIVLSHNEYFLHEIGRDVGHSEKQTLRITENFLAKASIIEACDLNSLVKNDYFKHIESLEDFRVNPNHAIKDSVLGWLRNVLESHLRFKFYKEIRSMTGLQTFGRLISFLDTAGVVFRDNTNRSTIIANLKLINSVSWKPHHGEAMPAYSASVPNPNSITAIELDNLVQDTLNLIENQL